MVRYEDGTKLKAFRGSHTVCETDIKEAQYFLPGTYKAEGHASAPSGQSCHFSAAPPPKV